MRLKNQMKTNVIVALFHGIDNLDGKYRQLLSRLELHKVV